MMVMSWFAIVVLGFIALLVVGGLAGLAHLIFSEKARVVGTGLLFGALLAVAVAAMFGYLFVGHAEFKHYPAPVHRQVAVTQVAVAPPVSPSDRTEKPLLEASELEVESEADVERELSISLDDAVAAESATKPEWVDKTKDGLVGDVFVQVVSVGPYASRFEVERNVDAELEKAAREYVTELLGTEDARRVRLPGDYVHRHLVAKRYWETIEPSFGVPMAQEHLLVQYGPDVAHQVRAQFRAALVRDRLWLLGTVAAGVVGLLLAAFGYLKGDLATGGARRRSLRLVAGIVVVALLAAVGYLVHLQV